MVCALRQLTHHTAAGEDVKGAIHPVSVFGASYEHVLVRVFDDVIAHAAKRYDV